MSVDTVLEEHSVIHDKILFGMVIDDVRDENEVEDIIDDIYDQLEEDGFDGGGDDNWDWLVWLRGETCHIVMYAPLMTRASLLKVDGIDRLRPLSHTTQKMTDNRNKWFFPLMSRRDTLTPSEKAMEMLQVWQGEQYAATGIEEEKAAEIAIERAHEVSDVPLPRRKRKESAKAPLSASELMEQMNLESATDSEGKKFVFTDND